MPSKTMELQRAISEAMREAIRGKRPWKGAVVLPTHTAIITVTIRTDMPTERGA